MNTEERAAARERRDEIRATGAMRTTLDRCGLLEMADALDADVSRLEADNAKMRQQIERAITTGGSGANMSDTDRPLGIRDLIEEHSETGTPEFGECYFWCRRHEQAHKVGEKCKCTCITSGPDIEGPDIDCPQHGADWAMDGCIDVGLFMSEREANRLMGKQHLTGGLCLPLGMEIER